MVNQPRTRPGHGDDPLGQFVDGDLVRIADVDRPVDLLVRIHQADEALDQVVDEAERAGLFARAVDGDLPSRQGLDDEVGDHAPVIRVHARAIGVEDAHDPRGQAVLLAEVRHQGLGEALALVVAGARPDRVDVAAIALHLRVDFRVAVDLRGRGLKEARPVRRRPLQQV
ncbi:hypothetical protein D3C77_389480 [compost metagenome]